MNILGRVHSNRKAVVEPIAGRPAHVNIVATYRDAPPELVELGDTVTEMVKASTPSTQHPRTVSIDF